MELGVSRAPFVWGLTRGRKMDKEGIIKSKKNGRKCNRKWKLKEVIYWLSICNPGVFSNSTQD